MRQKHYSWFITTRKGTIYTASLIMVSVFAIGLVAAAFTGRITWDVALKVAGAALMMFMYHSQSTSKHIAEEDNTKRFTSQELPKLPTESPAPIPSNDVPTRPSTPSAIHPVGPSSPTKRINLSTYAPRIEFTEDSTTSDEKHASQESK
jgi:hypothetical protein